MAYASLTHRALIALSGDDRVGFLQGIITQDAKKLSQGETLYAALLSPQGKFLHDFFLIPRESAIWLDVKRDHAASLLARLNAYKLRSKVVLQRLDDSYGVIATWGNTESAAGGVTDPRLAALGQRHYGNMETLLSAMQHAVPAADYEAHRIALAIPDGAIDMVPEKSLLMEFGFEDLHGVSFSKGCYVGQEVTARSKYRSNLRRHVCRVTASQSLPPKGAAIMSEGQEVGELLSVAGTQGLALLKIESIENSSKTLRCADIDITSQWPFWLVNKPIREQ